MRKHKHNWEWGFLTPQDVKMKIVSKVRCKSCPFELSFTGDHSLSARDLEWAKQVAIRNGFKIH